MGTTPRVRKRPVDPSLNLGGSSLGGVAGGSRAPTPDEGGQPASRSASIGGGAAAGGKGVSLFYGVQLACLALRGTGKARQGSAGQPVTAAVYCSGGGASSVFRAGAPSFWHSFLVPCVSASLQCAAFSHPLASTSPPPDFSPTFLSLCAFSDQC